MSELREAIIDFFVSAEASGMEYAADHAREREAKVILAARAGLRNQAREFFDDVWPEGGEVDDWTPLSKLLAAIDASRSVA